MWGCGTYLIAQTCTDLEPFVTLDFFLLTVKTLKLWETNIKELNSILNILNIKVNNELNKNLK